MRMEDMILVSVDDHVIEPPTLFDQHIPAKWRDRAPKMVRKDDGTDVWVYEGVEYPNIALNATVGRPKDEYGVDPTSLDDIRRGCWDVDARVMDMNANGVLGSLCFPSFPQFCGQVFARSKDYELGQVVMKAYNDWHIDEWCGSHPGRFIPNAIPGLVNPEDMAEEVRRVARKGCHAVTFSENPYNLGFPSLYSDHWDPFWKACADEGVVVNMHIGSSSKMPVTAPDAPANVPILLSPVNLLMTAADLLYAPMLHKFPGLRIALSEGGIGWIPYFLERTDYSWEAQKVWTGQDFGGRRPSDVFREHIFTCFIEDYFGLQNRHAIGVDLITWECDYPHSDTTWPESPERLAKQLAGIPDDEVDKITHQNAMRFYQYDPFAHIPREQCTVGALREKAAGWDISVRETGKKSSGIVYSNAFGGMAMKDPAKG